MPKFNWVISTMLVSAMITSGLSTQAVQRAFAQSNVPRSWTAIFGNLFNQKQDNNPSGKEGTGVGRGGVCALTPRAIGNNAQIWSDRPLFVAKRQGPEQIQQIKVSSSDNKEVLWDQKAPERVFLFSTLYGGEKALQPGQTYNWVISYGNGTNKQESFTFKIMDAKERDRIQADLTKLEQKLQGDTAEQIALQRAEYFAQKQLWSDVLREVYSVKNPSPKLEEKVTALEKEVCFNLLVEQKAARSR